ncbi:MAG: hypothetical protein AAF899_06705 [Pseudomonadota bacterium]
MTPADDAPLTPADRALIECAVVILALRIRNPEAVGLMQDDLVRILPDTTPFHPRLRALEDAMAAFVRVGDLNRRETWGEAAMSQALWEVETAVIGIFAPRAQAQLQTALDAQARAA